MTAEQYTQAVKAGMVSAEQVAMVNAAVEQQMRSLSILFARICNKEASNLLKQ